MSLYLVVGLWGLTAIGFLGLAREWGFLREIARENPPRSWPWGVAAWRGYTRIGLPAQIGVMALAVFVTFPSAESVAAYVFVLAGALCAAIILFNRPRTLVPPRRR